jgi:hypothetical protein
VETVSKQHSPWYVDAKFKKKLDSERANAKAEAREQMQELWKDFPDYTRSVLLELYDHNPKFFIGYNEAKRMKTEMIMRKLLPEDFE